MKTRYKFIHFVTDGNDELYQCLNSRGHYGLGWCQYNTDWNQWVFEPNEGTEYSIGCLRDIADFMAQLGKPETKP